MSERTTEQRADRPGRHAVIQIAYNNLFVAASRLIKAEAALHLAEIAHREAVEELELLEAEYHG